MKIFRLGQTVYIGRPPASPDGVLFHLSALNEYQANAVDKTIALAQAAMDQTGTDCAEHFYTIALDPRMPPPSDWRPILERPAPDPKFGQGLMNAILVMAVLILGATAWFAFH